MSSRSYVVLVSCLLVGCSDNRSRTSLDPATARSNIVASLPTGWVSSSAPRQQQGFTTDYFAHPETEEFMLVGPQTNIIYWTDHAGQSHREGLARECLYVWIVHGEFQSRLPRFNFRIGAARLPERVYSARGIRVYTRETHHIADTNRFDEIMKDNAMSSWGDISLSWKNWRRDIAGFLAK